MSVLYSLKLSAYDTIQEINRANTNEKVDFKNIGAQTDSYEYQIEIDLKMHNRALLMIKACEKISSQRGYNIYGDSSFFQIPSSIMGDLYTHMNGIMDENESYMRAISRLLAESLHDHPQGMEYLYLRSKVFSSNRGELKV